MTETAKPSKILESSEPAGKAPQSAGPSKIETVKMASAARMRRRHWSILMSFGVIVILPLLLAAWYLYVRAQDQFVSYVGFTVRSEEFSASTDLLGGLSAFGSSSSPDADILYEFIQSRELVRAVDEKFDLRSLYSAHRDRDPIFAFSKEGTIEDLTNYWGKMVRINYDSGPGLIELRVHAFTPEDAQNIAKQIFETSSIKINDLSAIAREDATSYSREELNRAVERLKAARQAITEFRSKNLIVDPEAEIGAQNGLITALQSQLSNALIALDVLRESASTSDPRLASAENRIAVIRNRIEEERLKFGSGGAGSEDYSALVGEYEGIVVDREFAEQAYLAALAAYDSALVEAQRKSRYLAAYIEPTLAERAEYPQRFILISLVGMFMVFFWTIATLVFYAIKDRR